ncbi:MAG TPA: 3-phosphoshikimate 1-carboxyvinyltransferase [Planctomycetes bacterium]|nr:3-phosphoshikimate 1-carboxyvinyltransferase [Planctomycetota bacterium]HIK81291.1 3-phosphoshikimate 1-carboxyvinyltransferase [Planctomycetota bacterium]
MERDLLLCNPACLDAVGQCWVYDPAMNSESTARIWSVDHRVSLRGQVRTAGSKSVAQRVIFSALLADGESQVIGAPKNDDLEIYLAALIDLGFEISGQLPGPLKIVGCAGRFPAGAGRIDVGANGTGMRFLTALLALRGEETHIDGVSHRPILPLVQALRDLGCDIDCEGEGPPVCIRGGSMEGGRVVLQAAVSSQFASALMLIAPHLPAGLILRLVGPIYSRPYIDLTAAVLRAFGVKVGTQPREITVMTASELRSGRIEVEADASSAAFPLCAAALVSGDVTVEGVGTRSLQGDRVIGEILSEMGCPVEIGERSIRVHGPAVKAISRNMEGTPDLVPAVAVVAAFARGESIFSGVSHLRVKETDRLMVLCRGMKAMGIRAEVRGDLLRVVGSDGVDLVAADLDPARDHRMAMAFSLLALKVEGTRVLDADCVSKSDPHYFERLEGLFYQRENSA